MRWDMDVMATGMLFAQGCSEYMDVRVDRCVADLAPGHW
jgi:hypothetical protein